MAYNPQNQNGQALAVNSAPVVPASDAAGISDMTAALHVLMNMLASPIWQEAASGRIRVVLDALGGAQTLGTITTVGTVTSMSQIGGIAANSSVYDIMHTCWADAIRGRVV